MSGRRGIDHLSGFEPDVLTAEVLEQPGAAAEQHGHEVDLDLLGQSALMYCCPISAPPMMCTFLSPAAALASCRARPIPPVTTVYTRPSGI